MLLLGSRFHNTPVMSLQTGTKLAETGAALIDPGTLKIVAFEVEGPLVDQKPSFLRTDDIREMGTVGMIIDSNDEIIGLDDVIKIEELYNLRFSLVGMPVMDQLKHRLGKVEDYTLETGDFIIQQLNVKRGILRGLTETSLLVHRSQIVEINDNFIVVKSTNKKSAEPIMNAVRTAYVNPFRATSQTEEA